MVFPNGSVVKNPPAAHTGDSGLIPGSERSPGGGNGDPVQVLSGGPHVQRSLLGYSPRGSQESDTTERLSTDAVLCDGV